MSFNNGGYLETDDALRMLDLLSQASGSDFYMSVESKGKKVAGEIQTLFSDNMEVLEIGGYSYVAEVASAPGSGKGVARGLPLAVVRDCDAATASIASLLYSQDSDLIVNILVFKAGGDNADRQPFFEIELTGGRVSQHAILTGGVPKRPCEIVVFSYRAIEIKSAPQLVSGIRGAVRAAKLVNH
ncbi:type VI secretion system tube protein Hcp [Variovorax sp. EL159]|uniref:type VI secretion system tube protein Hcp n=1 Tax=Variovorax sp. EL159 TaxID=1566270 RepID=UPI000889FB1D|nr:type VI secretion system tube protein Hcp [Variovorax sp. EL159]SCX74731.1 Type VI secretion system effector, Hcp [Variovorax sp. EL159]